MRQDDHPSSGAVDEGVTTGGAADLTALMQLFLQNRQRLEMELAEERK